MTRNLNPYPAYKDAGVPWLGEVPAHWTVQPIGRIGQLFKGNGGNKGDEVASGIPCVRYGDLYTRHEFFIKTTRAFVTTEKAANYTPIQYGDVLFAASGETLEDIGRSAVNLIKSDARCGGDILLLRPEIECVPRFLGYVADSAPSRSQKAAMGRGFTVVHIYGSQLKRLTLPLPPLPEQHAITRYLDYMDRRINRYIRAKRTLVTLLEEQKQAIIHHAVTRGLDPNVALRPSGVEWLGDVPAHWEVKRIKYLLQEVDERSTTGEETLLSLRMNLGVVPHSDHFARPGQAATLVGYKRVYPGQVVMNRLQANNGLVFATDIHGVVSPDYAVFDAIWEISLDYLTTLFRTPVMKHKFRIESKGLGTGTAGFLRLYTDRFGMISVPLPPVDEQAQIMATLDSQLSNLRSTTARIEREITLLREYRTRLIADVVTGKLDVRAAAAALPEAGEDAASDDLNDPDRNDEENDDDELHEEET